MMSHTMMNVARSLLITACLASTGARAEGKTLTLADIQSLVAGLGYADSGDKKTYVQVDSQGQNGINVLFAPTDEGKTIFLYTDLADVPEDKLAAMPAQKMLEYSDSHPFFFTINPDSGKKSIFLETRVDASTVTPQLLRARMDALVAGADETTDLWKTDGWKVASTGADASGKSYQTLQDEADAAWEKGPLTIRKALLTKDKASDWGVYTARANSTFKPGEVANIYIEPMGYDWKKDKNDLYKFGVVLDFSLKAKNSDLKIGQDALLNQPSFLPSKFKELFITFNLTLKDSLPVGDYTLTVTLHDLNSTKVATSDIPLTIAK